MCQLSKDVATWKQKYKKIRSYELVRIHMKSSEVNKLIVDYGSSSFVCILFVWILTYVYSYITKMIYVFINLTNKLPISESPFKFVFFNYELLNFIKFHWEKTSNVGYKKLQIIINYKYWIKKVFKMWSNIKRIIRVYLKNFSSFF